jgi:hypothetical protein
MVKMLVKPRINSLIEKAKNGEIQQHESLLRLIVQNWMFWQVSHNSEYYLMTIDLLNRLENNDEAIR